MSSVSHLLWCHDRFMCPFHGLPPCHGTLREGFVLILLSTLSCLRFGRTSVGQPLAILKSHFDLFGRLAASWEPPYKLDCNVGIYQRIHTGFFPSSRGGQNVSQFIVRFDDHGNINRRLTAGGRYYGRNRNSNFYWVARSSRSQSCLRSIGYRMC